MTSGLSIAFWILLFGSAVMNLDDQRNHQSVLLNSRQLILVTTSGWDEVRGSLRRFERNSPSSAWRPAGEAIPIVVGRNGMAWGTGLHDLHGSASGSGPIKKEGDGRAPAGIFNLGRAFGYEGKEKMGKLRVPYLQAIPTLECVDDTASAHYNEVLDRKTVSRPDWKSSEQMRRDDDQYRLGMIVEHNSARTPGGGSCIFLHIWAGAEMGTAGCTAMQPGNMESILRWLDAKKKPLLVQLPESEFKRLQKAWSLPE